MYMQSVLKMDENFIYLSTGFSTFSILKSEFTAISCASDIFLTPAAADIIWSREMNLGGEAEMMDIKNVLIIINVYIFE